MLLPRIDLYLGATYRDLHSEREYLLKRTFPEIRRMCEQKGVLFSLTEIKWSEDAAIANNQLARLVDVLSSPSAYYIGIKSAVRSIPPAGISSIDIPSADLKDSISKLIEDKASWFEIECAFVERLLDSNRATLFVKEGDVAESSIPVRAMHSPEEILGTSVFQVIEDWISNRWSGFVPDAKSYHEIYLRSRTINALLDASKANQLIEAFSRTQPVVLLGDPGSGRSTTIGLALQALTAAGEFVIPYVLEGSETSEQTITRYLIEEISSSSTADDARGQKSVADLSLAFAKFKKGQCVIALDGVEHLDQSGKYLAWLPNPLPANIKIVVSTNSEEQASLLVSKGWHLITMGALPDKAIYGLIQHLSWVRNIHFTPEQIEQIARHPLAIHPQFLITLFDELGQFGWFKQLNTNVDEYLDETSIYDLFTSTTEGSGTSTAFSSSIFLHARLLYYLGSHSIVELSLRVIERLEYDFGAPNVTRILSYLAIAKRGLTIASIEELTALKPEVVRHILNALGHNLLFSGNRILLGNEYLANAVKARYLTSKSVAEAVRSGFIRFLEKSTNEDDLEELVGQYIHTGQRSQLQELLIAPASLSVLIRKLSYDTLHAYLKSVTSEPVEVVLLHRLSDYSALTPSDVRVDLLCDLANFLLFISKPVAAREMLEVAIAATNTNPGLLLQRGRIFRLLGRTLYLLANYKEAEGAYRNAIDTFASMTDGESELLLAKQDLAYLLAEGARYTEAEELYESLISRTTALHGERSAQIASLNNSIALMRNAQGRYDEAIDSAKRAQEFFIDHWGTEYPELGWCYHILATAYRQKGEFTSAGDWYLLAIERFRQIYGEEHPVTLRSMYGLSVLLQRQFRFEEAEGHARKVVELRTRLLGETHADTAAAKVLLGSILKANANYEESELLLVAGLSIFDVGANKEHPEVARTLHELGELYVLRNRPKDAAVTLARAYSIRNKVLGSEHPDTRSSYALLTSIDSSGVLLESQNFHSESHSS